MLGFFRLSVLCQAILLAACIELPRNEGGMTVGAPAPDASAVVEAAVAPEAPVAALPAPVMPQKPDSPEVSDTVADNALPGPASPASTPVPVESAHQNGVDNLCEQIGNKLGSVSVDDCLLQGFVFGGGFSVNQRPLVIKEHRPPLQKDNNFKVLIMGGIHGDEYSSISIMFKWLGLFEAAGLEGEFHWRFAPLVNPDGLLDGGQAKRQNANGVDLNRNFPSMDWNDTAASYWQESTGSNPRRFPGKAAASEPEVQWIVNQIEEFQPDVIVSVHAPYHLLDFDGPANAPDRIGELYLHQLGVYPGSLGNFTGLNRRIPVVTLELPSAGIMPPADQINLMWRDLVVWLDQEGRKGLAANRASL